MRSQPHMGPLSCCGGRSGRSQGDQLQLPDLRCPNALLEVCPQTEKEAYACQFTRNRVSYPSITLNFSLDDDIDIHGRTLVLAERLMDGLLEAIDLHNFYYTVSRNQMPLLPLAHPLSCGHFEWCRVLFQGPDLPIPTQDPCLCHDYYSTDLLRFKRDRIEVWSSDLPQFNFLLQGVSEAAFRVRKLELRICVKTMDTGKNVGAGRTMHLIRVTRPH